MLLMVEKGIRGGIFHFIYQYTKGDKVDKGIRGGIFHFIYQYTKANNKYMKDYDKDKEWSYL